MFATGSDSSREQRLGFEDSDATRERAERTIAGRKSNRGRATEEERLKTSD
jgi:hypothetical protein